MQKRCRVIDQIMQEEGFWDQPQKASQLQKEREALSTTIQTMEDLEASISDLIELDALSNHPDERQQLLKEYNKIKARLDTLEDRALFCEPYDQRDAIITIRAGAGGTDAQDWSALLAKMYMHWAQAHHYKSVIMQQVAGAEAGIKSMTIEIRGEGAYGWLRGERGIHRLVRLSPFNADHLRQTSFAEVEVLPIVPDVPQEVLSPEDLKIDTFRSSGAGGQSVNTTDSAVRITHRKSGIVVTCQNERSQRQNKEMALKILAAKLYQRHREEQEQKTAALRGERKKAEWGSQIRSYVMHPYKMVKDHRTQYQTSDVEGVLSGDLEAFMLAYLRWNLNT